jgi:type IV pilus assembly protein PilM
MTIDYQVLGRYPSEKRLDLLLAAVSNDRLARLQAPLRALGLEADIVEPAPLALANALSEDLPNSREAQILLDIGQASSHLSIYQRGEPYFTRRLDFGGRNLTHAIAEGTQVPFDEAEEWKLAAGSDEPGFRVDWNSAEMRAVSDGLREGLVDELLRSLAFYRTIGQLTEPLRLWISGGTARLPGVAIRLADLLGMPVEVFNPLEEMLGPAEDGVPRTAGPQFALAFGLASRSA